MNKKHDIKKHKKNIKIKKNMRSKTKH